MDQVFLTRLETGEGLGSPGSPYYVELRVGNWYEMIYGWVCPFQASLVGLTASGQEGYRVTQGSLGVEVGVMEEDGTWLGWDWGPAGCEVTPARMAGVADWQWDGWCFERGLYVLPARSMVRVRLALEDCMLGDGSGCRWQCSVVLEEV